jgi:hypothetical protein
MSSIATIPLAARWLATGTIIAAASWVAYSVIVWIGYGRAKRPARPDEGNPSLDRLMPVYEVVERRHTRVAAPAEITFAAATSVLAQTGCRELVFCAIARPWEPELVLRTLDPEEFASFAEPGYAKVAWSLRVDPIGENESIARTETRVVTTDAVARAKFRRNWAFLLPGIRFARPVSLRMVKQQAERCAQQLPDIDAEQSAA